MTIKKISTLLLISLLILLSASITWAAAGPEDTTVVFGLASKTAQPGENITVYLMVEENTGKGFDAADFLLTFDNTYLEILNADMNPDLSLLFVPNLEKKIEGTKQDIVMAFAAGSPITGSGGLASLEFKVKDNAPMGTVINIDLAVFNKIALSSGGTVDYTLKGGSITVGSGAVQEDFPTFVGQAPQTPIPTTANPVANSTNPDNASNTGNNTTNTDPSGQTATEPVADNVEGDETSDLVGTPPIQPVPISGGNSTGAKNNTAAIIWAIIGVLVVAAGVFLLTKRVRNQKPNNDKPNNDKIKNDPVDDDQVSNDQTK